MCTKCHVFTLSLLLCVSFAGHRSASGQTYIYSTANSLGAVTPLPLPVIPPANRYLTYAVNQGDPFEIQTWVEPKTGQIIDQMSLTLHALIFQKGTPTSSVLGSAYTSTPFNQVYNPNYLGGDRWTTVVPGTANVPEPPTGNGYQGLLLFDDSQATAVLSSGDHGIDQSKLASDPDTNSNLPFPDNLFKYSTNFMATSPAKFGRVYLCMEIGSIGIFDQSGVVPDIVLGESDPTLAEAGTTSKNYGDIFIRETDNAGVSIGDLNDIFAMGLDPNAVDLPYNVLSPVDLTGTGAPTDPTFGTLAISGGGGAITDLYFEATGDVNAIANDLGAQGPGQFTPPPEFPEANIRLRVGGSTSSDIFVDYDTANLGTFESVMALEVLDPADLTEDGFVDGLDLGLQLANWGQTTNPFGGELNGAAPIDGLDLGLLLGSWNPPPLAAAVPEPTSLVLIILSTMGIFTLRLN